MILSTNDCPLNGLRGMDSALCGVSLDVRMKNEHPMLLQSLQSQ
jgi:hypothetical protein